MTNDDSLLSGNTIAEFTYTNHRGETSRRRAIIRRLFKGATEWHREPQWLIDGIDLDKRQPRTYALKDVHDYVELGRGAPPVVVETASSSVRPLVGSGG